MTMLLFSGQHVCCQCYRECKRRGKISSSNCKGFRCWQLFTEDYKLSSNEYFSVDVHSGQQSISAELVLQKALDREKQAVIHLILTAIDGGKPPKSGTLSIVVNVMDVNDNKPIFSKPLYKVKVKENTQIGTKIVSVSASDLDEGFSSEIQYSFHGNTYESDLFSINSNSGESLFKVKLITRNTLQLNCVFRQETKAFLLKVHTVKF